MKKLTIEKYIQGKLDESFTVPIAFISMLNTILPKAAMDSLNQYGFDLQNMIAASKDRSPYHSTVKVEEKGILKTIEIHLK